MEKNDLFLFTYLNISIRIYHIPNKITGNFKLMFVYYIIIKNKIMKPTAVEFAVEQLEQLIPFGHQLAIRIILEQALEREKQQQGYSEEEVISIAKQAFVLGKDFGLIGTFKEWFDTVKKK